MLYKTNKKAARYLADFLILQRVYVYLLFLARPAAGGRGRSHFSKYLRQPHSSKSGSRVCLHLLLTYFYQNKHGRQWVMIVSLFGWCEGSTFFFKYSDLCWKSVWIFGLLVFIYSALLFWPSDHASNQKGVYKKVCIKSVKNGEQGFPYFS